MNKTLELVSDFNNVILSDFDGLENLKLTLDDLEPAEIDKPVFIEALACHGGCVHGPGGTAQITRTARTAADNQ